MTPGHPPRPTVPPARPKAQPPARRIPTVQTATEQAMVDEGWTPPDFGGTGEPEVWVHRDQLPHLGYQPTERGGPVTAAGKALLTRWGRRLRDMPSLDGLLRTGIDAVRIRPAIVNDWLASPEAEQRLAAALGRAAPQQMWPVKGALEVSDAQFAAAILTALRQSSEGSWLTYLSSVAIYKSIEDAIAIHGHNGSTDLIWVDDLPSLPLVQTERPPGWQPSEGSAE